MNLLKNKIFVALIAVAIVLCVLPTTLYLTGQRDLLYEGISLAAKPFRAAFGFVADGISGFFKYFSSVDALIKENEELREELDRYREDAVLGEIAQEENDWLREQLGFAADNQHCTFADASVIGYSASGYSSVFTIDRGGEAGIKKNMAVVSRGGVVGYVSEVGYGYSKVCGVTDISSAVGVYCPRSGVYGTAHGAEAFISDGLFCITGLSVDSDVELGDLFCSGGYGEIFPKDFAVGRVVDIKKDEFLRNLTVVLEPCAGADSVARVFVVTSVTSEDMGGPKG